MARASCKFCLIPTVSGTVIKPYDTVDHRCYLTATAAMTAAHAGA